MSKTGNETGRVLNPERITLWRNDVTVNYKVVGQGGRGVRGDICELSHHSLMRMAFVAHNTSIKFDVMVTLTYPKEFPSDGKAVKYHLKKFLLWLTRTAGVTSYFWFMEFQRRGAPHFHIFTNGGDAISRKKAVSSRWFEIVGSGDEKHLKAGTRIEKLRIPDAAGRYAAKYASKPYQKKLPLDYQNVGRWWGHSRDVIPEPLGELEIESWKELSKELDGWSHQRKINERVPMATLYNAAHIIQKRTGIKP